MSKCQTIGHNFFTIRTSGDVKEENCKDCGITVVFKSSNWTEDKEYMKAHKRDFIQPSDKEAWNLAYPDKKIVDDPKRRAEMHKMLTEKLGKKRLPKVATEYWINYGMSDLLKWHLTP